MTDQAWAAAGVGAVAWRELGHEGHGGLGRVARAYDGVGWGSDSGGGMTKKVKVRVWVRRMVRS